MRTFLGLGFDPAPGSVADVEAMLARIARGLAAVGTSADGLRRTARAGAWRGAAACAFRTGTAGLAGGLDEVAAALRAAQRAVSAWQSRLVANQREAERLDQLARRLRAAPGGEEPLDGALENVLVRARRLRARHLREAAAAAAAVRLAGSAPGSSGRPGSGWASGWSPGPAEATARLSGWVTGWTGGVAVGLAAPAWPAAGGFVSDVPGLGGVLPQSVGGPDLPVRPSGVVPPGHAVPPDGPGGTSASAFPAGAARGSPPGRPVMPGTPEPPGAGVPGRAGPVRRTGSDGPGGHDVRGPIDRTGGPGRPAGNTATAGRPAGLGTPDRSAGPPASRQAPGAAGRTPTPDGASRPAVPGPPTPGSTSTAAWRDTGDSPAPRGPVDPPTHRGPDGPPPARPVQQEPPGAPGAAPPAEAGGRPAPELPQAGRGGTTRFPPGEVRTGAGPAGGHDPAGRRAAAAPPRPDPGPHQPDQEPRHRTATVPATPPTPDPPTPDADLVAVVPAPPAVETDPPRRAPATLRAYLLHRPDSRPVLVLAAPGSGRAPLLVAGLPGCAGGLPGCAAPVPAPGPSTVY